MSRWPVPPPYPKPCSSGKRRYSHKPDAKRAAKRVESSANGRKVGRVEVYRCRECDGWHVGHSLWNHRLREAS